MTGAWVLVILIAVMIVFVITVHAISKHRERPILTQKDVMEALKNRDDDEH
ncbi:hypothetical protein ACFYKX_06820 [Cytobacillus sp. FJAT-54145]|uniref:YtzI protein n=1 Tax=Cytobacillus spartinae TaxID=3299023 RepID=A0ABW6K812_9BACI